MPQSSLGTISVPPGVISSMTEGVLPCGKPALFRDKISDAKRLVVQVCHQVPLHLAESGATSSGREYSPPHCSITAVWHQVSSVAVTGKDGKLLNLSMLGGV